MHKTGQEPVPVQAETVALQRIQPSWSYSGEIRPDTEVQLAFKEPGYIAALDRVKGADGRLRDVQVGDEIPAGAVLAHLRRSDYVASLNTAAGQEHATQGSLDASQAELDREKADQAKADQDFERAQALYAAKAMTRPGLRRCRGSAHIGHGQCGSGGAQIEARRGRVDRCAGAGCFGADQRGRYEPDRSHVRSNCRKECGAWRPGCRRHRCPSPSTTLAW